MSEKSMKKINRVEETDELLEEYDFSKMKGRRGKYAGRPTKQHFTIELTRKSDRHWFAQIIAFNVSVDGQTREEAISKVQGLAFQVLAERIQQGKSVLGAAIISFSVSEKRRLAEVSK